ncbi:MAG TPA: antibiotic biosynthesis monooxygenase [Anaerolineaceae bacterium]|nr:antibiotic biosynthesis monooxygenase [Anaerolineaceae bacterium]
MQIVLVHVHVKPNSVEAFRQATIKNAEKSLQEPGIARFDVIQQVDDPTHFILVEGYRSADASGKHKETMHYKEWRNTVESMMALPRKSIKYTNVFPVGDGAA